MSIYRLFFKMSKPEQRFSPGIYALYRTRVDRERRALLATLMVLLAVTLLACLPVLAGSGNLFVASCAAALLILFLFGSVATLQENRQARILPYFERRLGDATHTIDTWGAGRDLLWNSRMLDQIAAELGVTPLSHFVSGDPLISNEVSTMFDAGDALSTVETLLAAEITTGLGSGVCSDLTRLRTALTLAHEQGVRFSLHLRIGSGASGYEMDQRRGSYF